MGEPASKYLPNRRKAYNPRRWPHSNPADLLKIPIVRLGHVQGITNA